MSSMLEQAVVDAAALREAALESAKQAIVERYSSEVKSALDSILEQDGLGVEPPEDPLEDEEEDETPDLELGAEDGLGAEGGEESGLDDQVPAAYPTGDESTGDQIDSLKSAVEDAQDALEDVDSALDDLTVSGFSGSDDEEIEIDFDQLEAEMEQSDDDLDASDMMDREDIVAESEEIDVTEEELNKMLEDLSVDVSPQKTGWAGTPESQLQHGEELAVAEERDSETKEKNDSLRSAVSDLESSLNEARHRNNKLSADNEKLKELLHKLKTKFEEVNVSNAKLLYTNKIFTDDTLNDRQKMKIAESISTVSTVSEAKVVYETLQSAVGSESNNKPHRKPDSLNEVMNNRSTAALYARPRRKDSQDNTFSDRMKRLAGINQ